ncbi:ETS-related transcription factor Elf-3-like [Haliotis asinina]|uniref:ETS-related transcription factor Elf-3-like n=1 Tax=Haliotis asinina TaxID=109174 RepID=UPI00353235E8
MDINPVKTESISNFGTYSPPARMEVTQMNNPQFHMLPTVPHVTQLIPVTSHLPQPPAPSVTLSQGDLDVLVSCLTQIACLPIGYGTEHIETAGNIPLFDELIDNSDTALRCDNPQRLNTGAGETTAAFTASTSDAEMAARFVQDLLRSPQTLTPHSPSRRQGHDFMQTRQPCFEIGQGHPPGSQSPQFEGQISPYGAQTPPFSGHGSQSAMEYYPIMENPDHISPPPMHPAMDMGYQQGQGQYYVQDPGATSQEGQPRLWKFILDLLEDPRYNPSHIVWVNRQEGIFRLIDPARLAELWGHVKGNKSMNYEKLSRGLRYYYTHNVMEHVPGKLVYKFAQGAQVWQYLSQTSITTPQRTVSSTATSQSHYPPHTSY